MNHKVTLHFKLPKIWGVPRGAYIEQTFEQTTNNKNEAEEFGDQVAKRAKSFMDGFGSAGT